MRALLRAGGLLKISRHRVRFYSKDKTFLPPWELYEKTRKAIEGKVRKLTHSARLRPGGAKKSETPALEFLCRALASSAGSSSSSSGKSKKPLTGASDPQQPAGSLDQSLSNKPPNIPLIPHENIKKETEIKVTKVKSGEPEIFNCKTCHENSPAEDQGDSDLMLVNCKNYKIDGSVLKEQNLPQEGKTAKLSTSTAPEKKPVKPPVSGGEKAVTQRKPQGPGIIKSPKVDTSVSLDPKGKLSVQANVSGSQVKANISKPQEKPRDKTDISKPQEKPTANAPGNKEAEKKPKAGNSQPDKQPQTPSFPLGRNPCTDGKRDSGKSKSAAKSNSCAEEAKEIEPCPCPEEEMELEAYPEKEMDDCSNKPKMEKCEKKEEEDSDYCPSTKPSAKGTAQDSVDPKNMPKLNPESVESKAKSKVNPSVKVVIDPKDPKVSPESDQSKAESLNPLIEVVFDPKDPKVKPSVKIAAPSAEDSVTPKNMPKIKQESCESKDKSQVKDQQIKPPFKGLDTSLSVDSKGKLSVKANVSGPEVKANISKPEQKPEDKIDISKPPVNLDSKDQKSKPPFKGLDTSVSLDPKEKHSAKANVSGSEVKDNISKPGSEVKANILKPELKPEDKIDISKPQVNLDSKEPKMKPPVQIEDPPSVSKAKSHVKPSKEVVIDPKDKQIKPPVNKEAPSKTPSQSQECKGRKPENDESKAKSQVKPLKEIVCDSKDQQIKPPVKEEEAPPKAASQSQECQGWKPKNDESKAKPQVKPSNEVDCDPEDPEPPVQEEAPPKAASQSQEWKQPPLPTDSFSFPLMSAFPIGRNPCRDGPRGASEKKDEEECEEKSEEKQEKECEEKPEAKPQEECQESEYEPKEEPCIKETITKTKKEAAPVCEKEETAPPKKKAPPGGEECQEPKNKPKEEPCIKESISKAEKEAALLSSKEALTPPKKSAPSEPASNKEPRKSQKPSNLKPFPVPPLNLTITAYLESIRPLLTAKEFKKEQELTEKFEENEGQELQELLEEAANSSSNWLTPRWTKAAYLAYQAPLTVFSSPGLSFPVQKFTNHMDCLIFTAKAIRAIYEFKELVDQHKIPVSKINDSDLDNSQFGKIFGTVRKPERFCDTIEQYNDSDYVVVVYKYNYFQLPILSSAGTLLSVTSLIEKLESIIECPIKRGEPFGLLTHDKRCNWAEAYTTLSCQPGNADTLEAIEQSLFLVCLDDCVPVPEGQESIVQAYQLLHGGGLKQNSANRWMDKTLQLIVNPNGLAGFCYEHSPADCQPLASLMNYVMEKMSDTESEVEESQKDENTNSLSLLKFQPMDECINLWHHVAMRNVQKITQLLRMNVCQYECHGKSFIKAQGLNPDSYIQMALQWAYYNVHHTIPGQYESAHLRMFVDGRTETIRSTSCESRTFILTMNSEKATQAQQLEALQKAVDAHEKLTTQALHGKGIDRHLFGLQQMALEKGVPMPEFFRSKGFVRSVTFQLFTSQVATKHDTFMACGPLTSDGYACCYNPQDDKIIFAISAWQKSIGVNPEEYGKAVKKCLDKMRRLILQTGGAREGEHPCHCETIRT